MMPSRRALLAVPGILLLARCAPPPPPPAVVDLTIMGGADQNPDPTGKPVSVAVRLYLLNATGRFTAADSYALMERERTVLGEDNAGSQEVVVRPGETKQLNLSPKPGVKFLGAAVLYREIDRATWRVMAPVAAHGPTKLVLKIGAHKAELGPA